MGRSDELRYRSFGRTGLQVSEIGFGGSRLGGLMAERGSGDSALSALRAAFDAGITFYDTADMYSQGEGEALLGKAFAGRRDKVILASKGGYCLPAQRQLLARIKPLIRPLVQALGIKRENLPSAVSGTVSQDFSPAYIALALEASLRRMKTDYLDIYQLHSPSAETIQSDPFLETLAILENMKRQGKIRHYGIAADTVADALAALSHPGIACVQTPFGLLDLEALDALLPQAETQGVGVIARGCFGGGLLKDSLTEAELRDLTPKAAQILEFRRLANQQNRPILELALQFVLKAPAVSVTLLGMRTEAHLESNLRYYDANPLADSEYAVISSLRN